MQKSGLPSDLTQGAHRDLLPANLGVILEFTGGEQKGKKLPLRYTRTVLGRRHGDVLVRDVRVSSSHLAIDFRANGFVITDLGSSNGTYLGARRVKQSPIALGDEVHLGESAFRLLMDTAEAQRLRLATGPVPKTAGGGLLEILKHDFELEEPGELDQTLFMSDRPGAGPEFVLTVTAGPDRGKAFPGGGKPVVIGRQGADIALADPDISRKHALIEWQSDQLALLRDLASTNGTFVNDRKVTNCVLREGDQIRLGTTVLVFSSRRRS